MINLYVLSENRIIQKTHDSNLPIDDDPIWIDLYNVTATEEKLVETYLGVDVPTRKEMQARAVSKRTYTENNAIYMTAMIINKSDVNLPESNPVTFALFDNCLITVRYSQPKTFKIFSDHITNNDFEVIPTGQSLFVGIMDAIIDRFAGVLEKARTNIDHAANTVFRLKDGKKVEDDVNYREIISKIGETGRLISKTRESAVAIERTLTYARKSDIIDWNENQIERMGALLKNVDSLGDYADFLSSEANFLLDATLGVIGIEQNDVMKLLSIVSIIFLPPTLVASIYGMNFKTMPETHWESGYYFAIGLMLLSAILSYRYFKKQKLF